MRIRSRRIYTEDGLLDGWMRVEDGKIVQFGKGEIEDALDFGDLRVIPGIFDTHIHGTQGYTMWEDGVGGDVDAQLDGFLKGVASEGVTFVLPTLFSATGDGDSALDVLTRTASRVGKPQNGASVAGIHFEGPYLHRVGEKGIRPKTPVINLDFVRKAIKAGGGHLKMMGLAPELPQAYELIDLLTENGVTAAFTHTDCNSAEAFAAFDRGITVATHTCNVMPGIHHRDVGVGGRHIARIRHGQHLHHRPVEAGDEVGGAFDLAAFTRGPIDQHAKPGGGYKSRYAQKPKPRAPKPAVDDDDDDDT